MFSFVLGHVGPPIPSCMVKLVDVPEKNYYARDGKGEVSREGRGGVIVTTTPKLK